MKNKIIYLAIMIITLLLLPMQNINAATYTDTIVEREWIANEYVSKKKGNTIFFQQFTELKRASDRQYVYCIEPGTPIISGTVYTGYDGDYVTLTKMSEAQWNRVTLLAYYGYGYKDENVDHTNIKWYVITQFMIWHSVPTSYEDIYFTDSLNGNRITKYTSEMQEMENLLDNHYKVPSFNNNDINMVIGESITLTDTNNVLSRFGIASSDKVEVTKSNNKLTIKANVVGEGSITLSKNNKRINRTTIVYIDKYSQNIMFAGDIDPTSSRLRLNIVGGKIKINKTDIDTNKAVPQGEASLKNATYGVYTENDIKVGTITTDELGKAESKNTKYERLGKMKKRIKNSSSFTNVKTVGDDGLLYLKSGEVACILEVYAIDLSLTSQAEKELFFRMFKAFYQIPNLNIKCYKLDDKLNLNANKINLENQLENLNKDEYRYNLLKEERDLIDYLEEEGSTISSKYYWVLIAKDVDSLNKIIDDVETICESVVPKIKLDSITNKLQIYKILSNIYLTSNSLDELVWSDLPSLISPINISERVDKIIIDGEEVELLTIKNIAPFVDELFLEELFNFPNARICLSIKDSLSQEELIRWVNTQYQFLLSDRNTTRKLSDATELDVQKDNYQLLMNDITNGDEKIKEVSLIIVLKGNKLYREEQKRLLKRIAEKYQIKLDVPRCRQMEAWQTYDITSNSFKDYAFYLPTLTLSASFPYTMTNFNDPSGYLLGVDIHTSLPVFFDQYVLNNTRTSHNMAIVASTGGGKSFTMKKMIVNEYARNTKIFIFDAEKEYKTIVEANNGEYIDLYSKSGGIINPLQIRYIPSDEEEYDDKETDCPLAKHLGFLEAFFKTAFESITEKELVLLLAIVEKLYNEKGIFRNTSINTLENLKPEDYPIFSDLYNFLPKYKESINSKEKEKIIEQLDILLSRFLTGTDSYLFDGYTTINLSNDLIAFNLQELLYSGNQRLINTQTLNLLTFLNNSIVSNKILNDRSKEKKHIMVIADEFHLFIDDENPVVLRNFGQLARRIRKYSGSLLVATQSIKDFVGSSNILRHSTAIFNNCQYQLVGMMKEDDLLAYLELFKQNPLTDTQKNFLLGCQRGEFLLTVDSKQRLRVKIEATMLEKEMMGENK